MAGIVSYGKGGGLRRIDFAHEPGGPRLQVRLGRVSMVVAKKWRDMIETIVSDKLANSPHATATSAWLGKLPESMHARLRLVGLADGVGLGSVTLGAFLDGYVKRRVDAKESTRTFYGHTKRNLIEHFGAKRLLSSITPGDAEDWKAELIRSGLAKNTVARRCVQAAGFFKNALKRRMILENPFTGLGQTIRANRARDYFLSREDSAKVLKACPTPRWRAIFALARWGGLRVPSELLSLTWADIDFDRKRFTVRASKTAHHDGGGVRMVPLFPELESPLLDLFTESEPGNGPVFAGLDAGTNLRQTFGKIVKRAGLTPWPKLWQNLRATRETELFGQYPAHVAAAWIGNTVRVAIEHYTQVRESDFEAATAVDQQAHKNAHNAPSITVNQGESGETGGDSNLPENKGFDQPCDTVANGARDERWAVRDSNTPLKARQKPQILPEAHKNAHKIDLSGIPEPIRAAVMALLRATGNPVTAD